MVLGGFRSFHVLVLTSCQVCMIFANFSTLCWHKNSNVIIKKGINHNFLFSRTLAIERNVNNVQNCFEILLWLWISLTSFLWSIRFYIISWILHAFWLVMSPLINFASSLIKQIDSMLPWLCTVINPRGCQNMLRTSETHSSVPNLF